MTQQVDDNLYFSCASKTFLLGEYLVLHDCPALMVTTEPRFKLFASPKSTDYTNMPFDPSSPAGQFLLKHKLHDAYDIMFYDPHHGAGGFGASSAQFLLSYILFVVHNQKTRISLNDILDEYFLCSTKIGHYWPSGADLAAQYAGNISLFEYIDEYTAAMFDWPFDNLSFQLVRTGKKLATHEHLRSLEKFNYKSLLNPLHMACDAIVTNSETDFITAIKQYAESLSQLGFVAPHTESLLKKVRSLNYMLAAKGCGALGADVILCLIDKQSKPDFKAWCQEEQLEIIADEKSISHEFDYHARRVNHVVS